jgi:hypothetical protein
MYSLESWVVPVTDPVNRPVGAGELMRNLWQYAGLNELRRITKTTALLQVECQQCQAQRMASE